MKFEVLYRDEGSIFLRCDPAEFDQFVNEVMRARHIYETDLVLSKSVYDRFVSAINRDVNASRNVKEEPNESKEDETKAAVLPSSD